jgi:NADPH-dependent 2,4-dienoyl-CoA reductase/sulfur reductase-like enzyme
MTIRNSVEWTVDQFRHAASAVESAGRVGRRTYENLHSPLPVMAAASPEPRPRYCRDAKPRSTQRRGSVISTNPNATAAPRRTGRRSIASGRYGRFSTASTAQRLSVLVPAEDEIIACRPEEVLVGRIRSAARLGAQSPNQLKSFTRCGMGPCQGRICGPIVSAVIADALGKPIAEIGTYRPAPHSSRSP